MVWCLIGTSIWTWRPPNLQTWHYIGLAYRPTVLKCVRNCSLTHAAA